jgi:hypothetical protein
VIGFFSVYHYNCSSGHVLLNVYWHAVTANETYLQACANRCCFMQVALDAAASGMFVTLLLDAWRLVVGGIVDSPAASAGLQWAVEVQQ